MSSLFLYALLLGPTLVSSESHPTSCRFPDQWSAMGRFVGPFIKEYIDLCPYGSIFVHYPSKTTQMRHIYERTSDEDLQEQRLWVYRDGMEAIRFFDQNAVWIKHFGLNSYHRFQNQDGYCDTRINRFLYTDNGFKGAIELNQELTDLKPILDSNNNAKFYEKLVTVPIYARVNGKKVVNGMDSTYVENIYGRAIYRFHVQVEDGKCIPLAIYNRIADAYKCDIFRYVHRNGDPSTSDRDWIGTGYEEKFSIVFLVEKGTYEPNKIGKYDRSVPSMKCANYTGIDKYETAMENYCPKHAADLTFLDCCQYKDKSYNDRPERCRRSMYHCRPGAAVNDYFLTSSDKSKCFDKLPASYRYF